MSKRLEILKQSLAKKEQNDRKNGNSDFSARNTNIMIWYKLKDKRPLAYKTGLFDGKKSDKVLVADEFGNYYIAEMYEGFLYGSEFCDFYDKNDFEIKNVEYWTEIESPF